MRFCPRCLNPGGIVVYDVTEVVQYDFKGNVIGEDKTTEGIIRCECPECNHEVIIDVDYLEITDDMIEVRIWKNEECQFTIGLCTHDIRVEKLLSLKEMADEDEDLAVLELIELLFDYLEDYLEIDSRYIVKRLPKMSEKAKTKLLEFLKKNYPKEYITVLVEV